MHERRRGLSPLPPLTVSYRPLPSVLRVDAHLHPLLVLVLEFHMAVDHAEERVVGRAPHVRPGVELGAALHHDDAARGHELAAKALYAEVLRLGITTVAGGAYALLMSHVVLSRASRRRFSLR